MAVYKVPYKGTATWYIDYYHEGKRIKERIGREDQGIKKKDAEKALKARMGEIVQGKFNLAKASRSVAFDVMVTHYLEWSKANKKSHKTDCLNTSRLLESFSGMSLKDITSWHIEKYKSKRLKDGLRVASVNREVACLKHIFTKAIEWGKAKENPVKKVKLFKENNKRVRFLSKAEMESLLSACRKSQSPCLYNMVILALNTGMRRGEIFGLKWEDIDSERKIITIRETKNGEARRIPFNDEVMKLLGEIPKFESPYLFPGKKGERLNNFSNAFVRVREKAGLKDFRFHDLRHTFASYLVMSGVDLFTVKELLGHKDIDMTIRYSHLAPEHKKVAVNKVGDIMKKALENSNGSPESVKEKEALILPMAINI